MQMRLKEYSDPRLARKIAILRVASLLLLAVVEVALALMVASGEMTARGSPNGGRFVSDGVISTMTWSESPAVYVTVALYYFAMGIVVVGALYLALVRVIEKLDRRPLFRRKYPY